MSKNLLQFPLVVRPGALGDAVLTLPFLEALKKAGAEKITVVGTPASWRFLSPNSLEQVRIEDGGSMNWAWLYWEGQSPSPSAKEIVSHTTSAFIFLRNDLAGVSSRLQSVGISHVWSALAPVESDWQQLPEGQMHAAERILCAGRKAGKICGVGELFSLKEIEKKEYATWWMQPPVEVVEKVKTFLRQNGIASGKNPFVVLHPGAGSTRKCFPIDCWLQIAAWLDRVENMKVIAVFGPADTVQADAFRKKISSDIRWVSFEKKSLPELICLLQNAKIFIGHDSGVSHLAGRCAKTFVFFRSTHPAVWKPVGKKVWPLKEFSNPILKSKITRFGK